MNRSRYFTTIFLLLLTSLGTLSAQRLFRSERESYTMRSDAMSGTMRSFSRIISLGEVHRDESAEYVEFDLSVERLEGFAVLRLEGGDSPRSVVVNGVAVATDSDYVSPIELEVSRYLRSGRNRLEVQFAKGVESPLSEGLVSVGKPNRGGLSSAILRTEPRCRLYDYEVTLMPDTTGRFAWLDIAAVMESGYNYPEKVRVGFDIYHPSGRLLDYSSRDVVLMGRSRDTVRFRTQIYNADSVRWSAESPSLYHVTLLTRRDGVVESYTPVKVGYSDREFLGGAFYNFGERVELRALPYNTTVKSEDVVRSEVEELKRLGYNTLRPNYPQPLWFYDMCDELGVYVVEQASLNAPQSAHDRSVGGSPSNDPALLGEYIERVGSSYYRVRNHPSVVAFSLGAESGNGYNMYKAYEWMKGVESVRPIIYIGAQGEWNSDKLEFSR